jgi:hypothetical protein
MNQKSILRLFEGLIDLIKIQIRVQLQLFSGINCN